MLHLPLALLALAGTAPAAPPDPPVVAWRDLAYATVEGVEPHLLALDLYTREESEARPVLVMIHGGGWRSGDKANRSVTERKVPCFVGHGFVYVSVNYRLSDGSGVQHPTQVRDVASALAWVHDHAAEYGGDPERLFVMGHSAGAHLAALVATDERRLAAVGKPLSILEGVVCLDSAAYDLAGNAADAGAGARAVELYENAFGEDRGRWADASPLRHVAAGKGIPPMLLFHTGNRVAAEARTVEFAEALREAGVPARVVHAADRDHAGINRLIGEGSDPYTAEIMAFLADPRGTAATGDERDAGSTTSPAPDADETKTAAYDPLRVPAGAKIEGLDREAFDEARERALPLRIYLPPDTDPAPVVLFSHGLGGSRAGSPYLGERWAARGYVAVFLQHPGSDESVWRGVPLRRRMAAMREAASAKNLALRVQDVAAVLDWLEARNTGEEDELHGRLDLEHVGMSGHSFGAVTTQGVSGQSAGLLGQRFTDEKIDAALAMSPSAPGRQDPARAFGAVSIPWMLMTGTADDSPIGEATPESRLLVYPALPATIDRYELVLEGAEHSAFGERGLPGDRHERNPNHHRAILALSTAFWDAHLRGDEAARAWLHGEGARSVLEGGDRWQVGEASEPEDGE